MMLSLTPEESSSSLFSSSLLLDYSSEDELTLELLELLDEDFLLLLRLLLSL
jgi:hypothetical protein